MSRSGFDHRARNGGLDGGTVECAVREPIDAGDRQIVPASNSLEVFQRRRGGGEQFWAAAAERCRPSGLGVSGETRLDRDRVRRDGVANGGEARRVDAQAIRKARLEESVT